jgi:hypothetical protein
MSEEHIPGAGKWREPGVPHKGWQCIGIEDLEEPCHLCQMCEVQIVRYVHTMLHPDYGELEVGCICAGHMEQDLIGARLRETSFKQRLSRRMNWLRRRWRVPYSGNEFINTHDGFNVVVFQDGKTGARASCTSDPAMSSSRSVPMRARMRPSSPPSMPSPTTSDVKERNHDKR